MANRPSRLYGNRRYHFVKSFGGNRKDAEAWVKKAREHNRNVTVISEHVYEVKGGTRYKRKIWSVWEY